MMPRPLPVASVVLAACIVISVTLVVSTPSRALPFVPHLQDPAAHLHKPIEGQSESVQLSPTERQSDAGDEESPADGCVYGMENAPAGRVIVLGIVYTIVYPLLWTSGVCLLGVITWPVLSWPSFSAAIAVFPIVADLFTVNFPTWKYFGPGPAHVRGVTGNNYRLGVIIYSTVANLLITLLISIALVVMNETTYRAWFGFVVTQGLSAFSTYYAYTKGVPSFFQGTEDALNPDSCTGPQTWRQLSGVVRFTEIAFYIGPTLASFNRIIAVPFSLAVLICSGIALRDESTEYHRTTAIVDIVFATIELILEVVDLTTDFSKADLIRSLPNLILEVFVRGPINLAAVFGKLLCGNGHHVINLIRKKVPLLFRGDAPGEEMNFTNTNNATRVNSAHCDTEPT